MSFRTKLNLLSDAACLPVNCRICGGELIPALSPTALNSNVPTGVILAEHSEGAGDFYLCTDAEIYSAVAGRSFLCITTLAGNSPFMIEDIAEGKPRAVIINGSKAVLHSNSRYDVIFNLGVSLCCGAMHCGRLFGAELDDKYKLRWSGEGGLSDWKEGLYGSGSLTLDPERGEAINILELGEKLVVVRRYGLTVLSMFGAPENFAAEITNTDTDEIFKGTARVVGDKLIFYTASGLHSFDGSTVKKLPHRYSSDISSPVCSAGYGEKYFLSCRSDSLKRSAVLCYDCQEGESYLINVTADGLCAADKVYAYNSSGAFRLDEGGEYAVTDNYVNFGSCRQKTVTEIFVDGEADIEISNGKTARRFTNAKGRIRPRMRGQNFTVRVTGTKPVRSITATAEECDAV